MTVARCPWIPLDHCCFTHLWGSETLRPQPLKLRSGVIVNNPDRWWSGNASSGKSSMALNLWPHQNAQTSRRSVGARNQVNVRSFEVGFIIGGRSLFLCQWAKKESGWADDWILTGENLSSTLLLALKMIFTPPQLSWWEEQQVKLIRKAVLWCKMRTSSVVMRSSRGRTADDGCGRKGSSVAL